MKKLKGTRKLNKAISAQLEPFGISKAVLSDEYAYYFDSEKVSYKLTEDTLGDRFFLDFIKERFGYECKYPFILSLLHEVGHHKANAEIEGAIYDFCISEKARIADAMETAEDEEEARVIEYQYFNLPDEIMATQWAVAWAKAHPRKLKKMWLASQRALFDFYEANGLFDDTEE